MPTGRTSEDAAAELAHGRAEMSLGHLILGTSCALEKYSGCNVARRPRRRGPPCYSRAARGGTNFSAGR